MAGMTDAFEAILLDAALGDPNWAPGAFSVGVSTTTPTEAGANFTEPSGNNYAQVATADADWSAAATGQPGSKANANIVSFPTPSGSWGTLTHFGLFEASTLRIWGVLAVAQPVVSGNPVSFAVGTLRILLGDPGDTYA